MDPTGVFVFCDKDGDGRLTKEEFLRALRSAGACPTASDMEEVCKTYSSTPDLRGFTSALELLLERRPTPALLQERLGGLAQDGIVDVDALRFIATNFGDRLNAEEVAELLRFAEPDKAGNVKISRLAENLLPQTK
eukprot:TRINITY_DN69450_c0_g1_i1.p1 TRINITY_DN69450_c0_g1~~TRINITY_DN69450_c0_g1_i1.p1  ORF type:complete len:149 (-),score=19.31 TRINITY_DN69450_c0_g1_i1:32-439(-)